MSENYNPSNKEVFSELYKDISNFSIKKSAPKAIENAKQFTQSTVGNALNYATSIYRAPSFFATLRNPKYDHLAPNTRAKNIGLWVGSTIGSMTWRKGIQIFATKVNPIAVLIVTNLASYGYEHVKETKKKLIKEHEDSIDSKIQ